MKPDLWTRLRGARIVQILAVYLGASWVVLQIADVLQEALSLPGWLLPVAVVLLLVGLVVIAATAWVQAHPATDAREAAGEVPTDWEIAPADLGRAIRSGRLPHLTWGRAILGGVVSLSLLFGVAGGFVLLTGGRSIPLLGPTEAGAEDAATGVAVLPFVVTGPGLEVYREGMVDLVSTNLDGVSGLRAIDSRTVLSRWHRSVGEADDVPLEDALRVAAATGARYALVGSMVSTGNQIRLAADLWDLESREKVGSGRSEGGSDDILTLVDRLSVESLRELLRARGDQTRTDVQRLESVVTSSIPALTAYLEGERLMRRARFREARGAFERAVAEDSTFALAWGRLGETYGWTESAFAPGSVENKARALAFIDRVPPREATLLRASAEVGVGTVEHLAAIERHTTSFPDDPEGWYLLGEYYLHSPVASVPSPERTLRALRKAVDLDPEFSPYYSHVMRAEVGLGDSLGFRGHLAELERLSPEEADRNRIVWDYYRGGPDARAAAEAAMDTVSDRDLFVDWLTEVPLWSDDLWDEAQGVVDRLRARNPGWNPWWTSAILISQGRFADLREVASAPGAPRPVLFFYGTWLDQFGISHPDAVAALSERVASLPCDGPDCAYLWFVEATLLGASGDSDAWAGVADRIAADLAPVLDTASAEVRDRIEINLGVIRAREALGLGDAPGALTVLRRSRDRSGQANVGQLYNVLLADAAVATDQNTEAARHYEAALHDPMTRAYAQLRLGEVYEALGRTEDARRSYRGFLTMWENADPGLEAVDRARAGLQRTGG